MTLIGIDIGGTKTSVCLGDRSGRLRASRRMATRAEEGADRGLRRTLELVQALLAEEKTALQDIESVGISAPGPVSLKTGLMLEPPNMKGWVNVPLLKFFREALARPVFMNNDANACVMAEWRYGDCKNTPNLVYLTMSTGLGAGLILNNQLVQGVTDTAGEVGHHVLDLAGPPCPCGQRGCWEIYCGGLNVANRIRERINRERPRTLLLDLAGGRPEQIDFRVFVQAVRQQDALALEFWGEYIERLAQGMGTVIMMLNPEVIILGTIAIHTGDLLLSDLQAALPRFTWRPGLKACRIQASALGDRIGDLSALAVALDGLSQVQA